MSAPARIRDLHQDLYVQDLVLPLYRVYAATLRDAGGAALLRAYVRAEESRRHWLERRIVKEGAPPIVALRRLFGAAGRLYGLITARLGTRLALRIALSASRRASRRACGALDGEGDPELRFLAGLRARNESDLLDGLRQHLIDTRPS